MTRAFIHKLAAFALAAALLAGCSAPAKKTDRLGARDADDLAAHLEAFAPEYPAIDTQPLVAYGDAVAVSQTAARSVPGEVKSIWVSYLEMETLLMGKSEAQFRRNMQTVLDNIKNFGFNTVIVQVRPFADALYQSSYFPWSYLVTGTEGEDPGFDPFAIIVGEARSRGLRIEAWLNPYRVRLADSKYPIAKRNYAYKWYQQGDDSVVKFNGVTSYNPASTKAQNLIVAGAVEIVQKYRVDGIHIDDYFYPTTDKKFDAAAYKRYRDGGGKLSLDNWRRENVETLIRKMYAAIKKTDKNCLFGISPQSSVQNNYSAHYLDVEKIASTSGYCDYICPQIYFGFQNATQPFAETLDTWSNMVTAKGVKLYVGIAAYKCGVADSWAGDAGKSEWVKNSDMLASQLADARRRGNYAGIVVYRYDSLFRPASTLKEAVKKEAQNLKAELNK